VLKVFDMTAASTGLNEKQLKREQIPYEKVYVHPLNHAGYYPGGTQMSLKLIFDPPPAKSSVPRPSVLMASRNVSTSWPRPSGSELQSKISKNSN
jgi:NADPH-dependent 2,4-dienoyl-CoA reductase/sulfur reductase-like enzyme